MLNRHERNGVDPSHAGISALFHLLHLASPLHTCGMIAPRNAHPLPHTNMVKICEESGWGEPWICSIPPCVHCAPQTCVIIRIRSMRQHRSTVRTLREFTVNGGEDSPMSNRWTPIASRTACRRHTFKIISLPLLASEHAMGVRASVAPTPRCPFVGCCHSL